MTHLRELKEAGGVGVFRHRVPALTVGAFDLGGVLYHAKYLELLELTREAFLNDRGCSYRKLMDEGYHIVVAETAQRFVAGIEYGQPIVVEMWASSVLKSTFTLEYKVWVWPSSFTGQWEIPARSDRVGSGGSGDSSGGNSGGTAGASGGGGVMVHTAMTRLACVKRRNEGRNTYYATRIPEHLRAVLSGVLVGGG